MSAQYCPQCLKRTNSADRCESCNFVKANYRSAPTALPIDTVLNGKYRAGILLGHSRQSQCYTGIDIETSKPVIIEEFFPANVAGRKGLLVQAVRNQPQYEQACQMLLKSTQPRKLKKLAAFAANQTVYTVFEPVPNVDPAKQADVLLDFPCYFRDAKDNPIMTINALLIPPMPKERKFDPDAVNKEAPDVKPDREVRAAAPAAAPAMAASASP